MNIGRVHTGQRYLPHIGGGRVLTQSLVKSCLCTDGWPIFSTVAVTGDRLYLSDLGGNLYAFRRLGG